MALAPVFAAYPLGETFDEEAIQRGLDAKGIACERLIVVGELPDGGVACLSVVREANVLGVQPNVLNKDTLRELEQLGQSS